MSTFGTPFGGLTATISLSVTFLLLDRIFILTMPIYFRQRRAVFIGLMLVLCFVLSVYVNGILFLDRVLTFGGKAFRVLRENS
jgi:hypothetical protein